MCACRYTCARFNVAVCMRYRHYRLVTWMHWCLAYSCCRSLQLMLLHLNNIKIRKQKINQKDTTNAIWHTLDCWHDLLESAFWLQTCSASLCQTAENQANPSGRNQTRCCSCRVRTRRSCSPCSAEVLQSFTNTQYAGEQVKVNRAHGRTEVTQEQRSCKNRGHARTEVMQE